MLTRDERKAQNYIDYPASACGYLNSLTDKIYDDFQNRTCESCKLLRASDKACFLTTYNPYLRPASIDFSGCGRWEQK